MQVGCLFELRALLLNGKELGTKPTSRETQFKASWSVPHETGTLMAVGYTNNSEAARRELRTTGPATHLRLSADRTLIQADGQDLCFVTVEVVDAKEQRVPGGSSWCTLPSKVRAPWLGSAAQSPTRGGENRRFSPP